MPELALLETSFSYLVEALQQQCQADEAFTLRVSGEQSQFVRFNRARVRQTGCVEDCDAMLTWMHHQRGASASFPLCGDPTRDWEMAQTMLHTLRQELPQLPEDPYLVLPEGLARSRETHAGALLAPDQVVKTVLAPVVGMDFAGLYAGGAVLRAYADSVGQQHWFLTETFSLDYSIYTPEGLAVKGMVAGQEWDDVAYADKLVDARHQLERLSYGPKALKRGQYRTYLAPAAIAELISMFSWGAVSEAAMQQGASALAAMRREDKRLSPRFTLKENFAHGAVPRFNDLGEMAPLEMPIIQDGVLVNTLVSSRSAKEYGKAANGASSGESLRSPEVAPGGLAARDILRTLGTGLYLSNLHYLNWSDRPAGRITGMTRYACFWVENGEIVAPIENLRFDESLYRCFGEQLVDLTDFQEFVPEVTTYDYRHLGGAWLPGALVEDFTFTL